MTFTRIAGGAALLASTLLLGTSASAAITLTNAGYTQNFDTLASTGTANAALPAGWATSEQTYRAGAGTINNGGVYSFGSAGSSDRALGSIASGTTGTIQYGAFFVNGTGSAITSLALSYFGEEWRRGNTTDPDGLTFEYSLNATDGNLSSGTWTAVAALGFDSPNQGGTMGALDGNAAANRIAVSSTINALFIANGANFAIRWTDINNGQTDDGVAIDDLRLNAAAAVPEPASWAMMVAGFGLLGGALRRRRPVAAAAF